MASPTLSGKHSHRGACNASLIGSSYDDPTFWREPRAPVLLLEQAGACDQQKMIYPCSYFLGAGLFGLEQTKWNAQRLLRLLQHGLVLDERGAAGAARSSALAPWQGA
jgi:hypothetical protein